MAKKMRKRGGILLAIGIVLLLLFAAAVWQRQAIFEYFFPIDHQQQIEAVCEEYNAVFGANIDPWLVAAIIREESAYDAAATSHAGACGLMQLMPDTAQYIIDESGLDITAEQALWQPEWNIACGVWYLCYVAESYFDGRIWPAVAAYNAGHNRVEQWLEEGTWDGSAESYADIPYNETARYLRQVRLSYEVYQFLYDR
ncbi:MAG: lytic transglycosylase domain-containing protein [Bacillota bacterium]|nr:lytic transglycosylase domain-containing protein [Bacillota bacterium]